MENEDIQIVTVSDDGYAQHLGVMFCSLFEHKTTNKNINIYLINVGIAEENLAKLVQISEKYKFNLVIKEVINDVYNNFATRSHISNAAYYKIAMPDLLKDLNKVLFLDCDLIIKVDLEELWNTDLKDSYLAAVENPLFERYEELFIPYGTVTFNSGVMLINLDKWRADKVSERVTNFLIENSTKIRLHDQGGFNAIMYNNWIKLNPKWNQQTKFFELSHRQTTFERNAFAAAKVNPSIIHYTTSSKPWHVQNAHPFKKEYHRYIQLSPWEKVNYKDKNIKNIILKLILTVIPNRLYSKIRLIRDAFKRKNNK